MNGSKEGVPTTDGDRFKARYVRLYMNGNSGGNASNHLVELEVYGEPNLRYSENLAEDATVSASGGITTNLDLVINGDKSSAEITYANLQAPQGWIQLDLGIKHHINNVALWRYAGRSYYNTVVMISPDENFAPNTTLVLWNGNGANGGRNGQAVTSWPGDGNGQTGVETHELPTGMDATYEETSAGKVFKVTKSKQCRRQMP